jgi:DNA-binding winged helix-turn-helix (wHTH) protein
VGLTDFADAGLAPDAWNYVELEALIRFDWTEPVALQSLYLMEQRLESSDFVKFKVDNIEPPLRKTLRTIQTLRRMAVQVLGKDTTSYRVGMLFQAISRLANFDSGIPLLSNELMRLSHILIAAAIINQRMLQNKENIPNKESPSERGLRIEESDGSVWVNGERKQLIPQSFKLLLHLYNSPHRSCTHRELIEEALKSPYDEDNKSQKSRLHTAVSRLRDDLDDTKRQYIQNAKGGRYSLVLRPED